MNSYDDCYLRPKVPRKNSKFLLKSVAPLALSCIVGTGGVMTAASLANLGSQIYVEPSLHIESQRTNKNDTRSPAEHVVSIRNIFALNTSDLAAVLSVTRPTIYAWLEGQEPKPEMVNHIQKISQMADKLQALNIARVDKLVHRPIFDGYSLLDKLKANEDVTEYLPILKKLADKEEQARHVVKGSNKNARPFADAASDYSTPLYSKS